MDHGDCSETLHELYHFLDGELTDEKRAAIREHLEDCPPCFEAFDFEAEIKQYIAQKCRDRVPESLRARIAEAIGHEAPRAQGVAAETSGDARDRATGA